MPQRGPNGEVIEQRGPIGWMDQFASIVDTFGRFAQLLDMNCDAMYGSFSSILRLFESMAELRREIFFIFQTFTLFRLMQMISKRVTSFGNFITGNTSSDSNSLDLASFDQFQGKGSPSIRKSKRIWPLLFFLVSAIGGPVIINRLWRMLKASLQNNSGADEVLDNEKTQFLSAKALYNAQPQGLQTCLENHICGL